MKTKYYIISVLVLLVLLPISIIVMLGEVDYVSDEELAHQLNKASEGDADAMWYLTKRYHLHLEEDSAVYWAKKAYNAGNKAAGYYFGHNWGINVAKSPYHNRFLENKDYFYRTISMGEFNGTPVNIPYLKKWAKLGLPHAIREYFLYSYDSSRNPPISEDAFTILINGAKKGVAELQYLVREVYEQEGYREAIDWLYLTATNPKNCHVKSMSQRMLAKVYLKGDTVLNIKRDIPLAMYWMGRLFNDSKDERDVDCAKYNYQRCLNMGFTASTIDNTPFNKKPSGEYIWDKNKPSPKPNKTTEEYPYAIEVIDTLPNVEDIHEWLDSLYRHEL